MIKRMIKAHPTEYRMARQATWSHRTAPGWSTQGDGCRGQLRGPAKNGVGDHSLAEVTQQAQAGSKSLGAWVGFGMEPFRWVRE
jgi:hypothetical protein